jgi:arabinofuranosyltransferase
MNEITPIPSRSSGLAVLFLLLLFTFIFLLNAWVCDDAYITFRTIDNFLHGHGLRWNIAERVQSFTHPLWMMLMTLAAGLTSEFFFTTIGLSLVLCLAALLVFRGGATLLFLLVSSKAFMDYASSGLENPLSYLLLALFYREFLRDAPAEDDRDRRRIGRLVLFATLAYLNRPDAILLYLPALFLVLIGGLRRHRARAIVPVILGGWPAAVWHLFSLVYYGFFFPNTYYAKLAGAGVSGSVLRRQGWAYLVNSLNFDFITLFVTVLALVLVFVPRARKAPPVCAGLGVLLYFVYVIRIGGDFMSGRFLALPFLLGAFLVAREVASRRWAWVAFTLLALYNVIAPRVPIKTSRAYTRWDPDAHNGISDERAYYQDGSSLLFYSPACPPPDNAYTRLALQARGAPDKAFVSETIGFAGYLVGPGKFVIDKLGLTDPLLARLPISKGSMANFQIGHFGRRLPLGYFEWKAIAEYNLGSKRRYKQPYLTD